jgi:hypothetical protein
MATQLLLSADDRALMTDFLLCNSSGSLATFAAIRRASSRSTVAAR